MGAHVSVPMYRRSLPQRLALEGRRCAVCGATSFPPRGACERCGATALDPIRLSGLGRVYACTFITAAGAPPEFASLAEASGGYHVGIVDLDEGPRVGGQLVGFAGAPAIGARVRAVVRRLYEEEGVVRYGFKFRAAD